MTSHGNRGLLLAEKGIRPIGIDHDTCTVCAGGLVLQSGTARVVPAVATTSAVPDCSTNHDSADRIVVNFYSTTITILQKARETCVFDVLYRCSSLSAFAQRRVTTGQLVTSQLSVGMWRHKSPPSRLFTQPFIQAQIKENIKAPRHWPLRGKFIGDRWIPRTKSQMTSSFF